MRSPRRQRAFLAVCVAALVAIAATRGTAHEASAAGEPGNPRQPARTVDVVMSDGADGMHFSPDRVDVRQGEQVRFVIRNAGTLAHEFFLGGADENKRHAAMMAATPDMKQDDSNAKTVAPGETATVLWRFSRKGDFEFACLIPGHYEAGKHGTVAVK